MPITFFVHGNFQKKQFKDKEANKISHTIRIIGSNISLNRFYKNIDTEAVINELISISSPTPNKKMFFVWPEGIIPNVNQFELKEFESLFNKRFNEKIY